MAYWYYIDGVDYDYEPNASDLEDAVVDYLQDKDEDYKDKTRAEIYEDIKNGVIDVDEVAEEADDYLYDYFRDYAEEECEDKCDGDDGYYNMSTYGLSQSDFV